MKKKLFIIGLILVLLAGVAYARMTVVGIAGIVAEAGEEPPAHLLYFDFESGSILTDWTVNAGTWVWNHATNPLEGNYSLRGTYASDNSSGYVYSPALLGEAAGVAYVVMDVRFDTISQSYSSGRVLELRNSSGSFGTIMATPDGLTVKIGAQGGGSTSVSSGTDYRLWARFIGNDSPEGNRADIWVTNTSTTTWPTGDPAASTYNYGTANVTWDRIRFAEAYGSATVRDRIAINTSQFDLE